MFQEDEERAIVELKKEAQLARQEQGNCRFKSLEGEQYGENTC